MNESREISTDEPMDSELLGKEEVNHRLLSLLERELQVRSKDIDLRNQDPEI